MQETHEGRMLKYFGSKIERASCLAMEHLRWGAAGASEGVCGGKISQVWNHPWATFMQLYLVATGLLMANGSQNASTLARLICAKKISMEIHMRESCAKPLPATKALSQSY